MDYRLMSLIRHFFSVFQLSPANRTYLTSPEYVEPSLTPFDSDQNRFCVITRLLLSFQPGVTPCQLFRIFFRRAFRLALSDIDTDAFDYCH